MIPFECAHALCGKSARHPEGVVLKPPSDRGQPSTFGALSYGIASCLQCGFGVVGEYQYLSWLLEED